MTADEVRKQVEEFLAKGGKIEVVPFGVGADTGVPVGCYCGCKGIAGEHMRRAKMRAETALVTRRSGTGKRRTKPEEGY